MKRIAVELRSPKRSFPFLRAIARDAASNSEQGDTGEELVCMTCWERTSSTAFIFLHRRQLLRHGILCNLSKVPTLLLSDPFAKCLFSLLNTGDKCGKVRSLVSRDFIAEKLMLQSVTQKQSQE